ncbi:MAG: hypothetical protein ABEJ03_01250, partial [Candidatus Nanohaloarchaea archaeon]
DIYEVDPLVHNLWRWNDYAIINNGVSGWDVDDGEVDKFLSGIDDPDKWRDVKNKPERAVFPNYESDDTWRRGEFDFEEYSSADDLGEFLDWHMPLRIEYESQLDDGNSSDEMAKFGVIAERAAEEFADIDATFVPIKVPVAGGGSTYDGMGIAVDHTNEEVYLHGSDSFGVKTSEGGEDYHKLDELMDGEEPSEVWMPFGYARGENADEWGIGPNEAKSAATEIISSLAVGFDAGDLDTGSSSDGVAFTDEYLESRMDKLENYDEEEFSIHRLMNEAEVAVSLLNKDDKTFAMDVDENGEMYAAKVTPKTAEKVYKGEINDVRGYIQDKETAGSLSGPVDTLKSTAEGVYSSVRDFAS